MNTTELKEHITGVLYGRKRVFITLGFEYDDPILENEFKEYKDETKRKNEPKRPIKIQEVVIK